MKGLISKGKKLLALVAVNCLFVGIAAAEEVAAVVGSGSEILSTKACAILGMGIAVVGATNAQAKAISAALDSIGRNPGAAGSMFLPWLLALVFIESLVLFALVIAFQII